MQLTTAPARSPGRHGERPECETDIGFKLLALSIIFRYYNSSSFLLHIWCTLYALLGTCKQG